MATLSEVESAMRSRDAMDMNRAVAPLAIAHDAVVLDSTHLTIRQAIEQVLALAADRRG